MKMYELTPKEIDGIVSEWEEDYAKGKATEDYKTIISRKTVAKVLRHQAEQTPEQLREAVAKTCYFRHPSFGHGKYGEMVKINWADLDDITKQTFYTEADEILALSATERQEAKEESYKEGFSAAEATMVPRAFEDGQKKERERAVELVDSYIGHGKYVVEIDGATLRCISADLEYVWKQLRQALEPEQEE